MASCYEKRTGKFESHSLEKKTNEEVRRYNLKEVHSNAKRRFHTRKKLEVHRPEDNLYCPGVCECNLDTFEVKCGSINDVTQITYVPNVPKETKILSLRNGLNELSYNMFPALSKLQVLDLHNLHEMVHIHVNTLSANLD